MKQEPANHPHVEQLSAAAHFNDFIVSKVAPLPGMELGEGIMAAYAAIDNFEQKAGRQCGDGFIFGGAFTSLLRGETPKDVDAMIHAPDIVKLAKQLAYHRYEAPFSRDRDEEIEYLQSQLFQYNPNLSYNEETMTRPKHHPATGDHFQIRAFYSDHNGIAIPLDITFIENEISAQTMITRPCDAPVRAIAFNPDSGEYAYHKNFPEHAKEWLYAPFDPQSVRHDTISRMREKGMQIEMDGQ